MQRNGELIGEDDRLRNIVSFNNYLAKTKKSVLLAHKVWFENLRDVRDGFAHNGKTSIFFGDGSIGIEQKLKSIPTDIIVSVASKMVRYDLKKLLSYFVKSFLLCLNDFGALANEKYAQKFKIDIHCVSAIEGQWIPEILQLSE